MKFDNIELLRENIHRKDLQLIQKIRQRDMILIEERIKKWDKGSGWDDFVRMVKSDAENGKEAVKVDFTPIEIMCKFIENSGDPSVYLKAISISHPGHPFCQMLIECETVGQFLNNLKPMEAKLPILFHDNGKKWLTDLFEISKGFVSEEYESEMKSALDIAGACA
ncbi:MAG: hypothetical protein J5U17_10230 [Candidatus Methanoperedens sp.]|nr:hypothetical protein [Candidatus Methanoperedens sp.]MCE8428657.1 hypothetical protein [Candidatus Methanoperedens sp.]